MYWETLQVQRKTGEVVDITVEVPGRQYTRRNGKVAGPRRRRTGQIIPGENESLDGVERADLVKEFDDIPVGISWGSSDPAVLDWEGVPSGMGSLRDGGGGTKG